MSEPYKRKLIEVALPLEAINRESAREKSIRHGHPSTLHLWWARRPLAAARAVLFAQLVDDPSSLPEEFPTEEAQKLERERLHDLISRLVVWENIRDEQLLEEARAEILKSTDGNPPPILDPFAGGGTIPLEAQRLGLEALASDLNPVAVLINKALIEIPPKFRGQAPVFPGLAASETVPWPDARGLAADVRAYGAWIRDQAEQRIGHLYPKAQLPGGGEATVIAWIWARSVMCPNPACGAEVPLISSLDLGKKKGRERWLRPVVSEGRVDFEIASGPRNREPNKRGQGAKFDCWVCAAALTPSEVHAQLDVDRKPSSRLLAVVVSGDRRREYILPSMEQVAAAASADDSGATLRQTETALSPEARGTFGGNAQGRRYGFFTFADYFTNRQLEALTTFSDLVGEARERVIKDAVAAGIPEGDSLETGGTGAAAYADAVATYLGLGVSRTTDLLNSVVTWSSSRDQARSLFARQAISMAWDYVENSPFNKAAGDLGVSLETMSRALLTLPTSGSGVVKQADASTTDLSGGLLSTDPPYYDNIGYSDLSDFFYVWLRRTLRDQFPSLLGTMLVPKAEELVANSYRHGGKEGAKRFFEEGFYSVFARARDSALSDYPITVYYAFKQSDTDDDGESSSGWETLLEGMVRAGWSITATWPMRSERSGRMISVGTNALASAIVLALRPRPEGASTTDRRGFIDALHAELRGALANLQAGGIAPVDLPQAAIGPGMAVFSRYASVIESDGSGMSVRSALSRINEALDLVLNEQEGDFDATTRFAIAWFKQHGYTPAKFGDADNLARARNTAVATLERDEVLTSRAGEVALIRPADLRDDYDVVSDDHSSAWEATHHLIRILESQGVADAGRFLAEASARPDIDAELVPELAHLLFRVCEDKGWTKEAISFNSLVTVWPEILDASRSVSAGSTTAQAAFDFDEDN